MKLAVTAMAVVAAGLLGCGSGAGHTDGGAAVDAAAFDCNGKSCDPATQYCYEYTAGASADAGADGGTDWTPSCKPLPAACSSQASPSCDCMQASLAGTCSGGAPDCINSDGGIIVRCSFP